MLRKITGMVLPACCLILLAGCDEFNFPKLDMDRVMDWVFKDLEQVLRESGVEYVRRVEKQGYRIDPEHRRQFLAFASGDPRLLERCHFMVWTRIVVPCETAELLKALQLELPEKERLELRDLLAVDPDTPLCEEDERKLNEIMAAHEAKSRTEGVLLTPAEREKARRKSDATREQKRLELLRERSLDTSARVLYVWLTKEGIGQERLRRAMKEVGPCSDHLFQLFSETIEDGYEILERRSDLLKGLPGERWAVTECNSHRDLYARDPVAFLLTSRVSTVSVLMNATRNLRVEVQGSVFAGSAEDGLSPRDPAWRQCVAVKAWRAIAMKKKSEEKVEQALRQALQQMDSDIAAALAHADRLARERAAKRAAEKMRGLELNGESMP